jgi:UDP-glucuronate decarboxylase
MKNILVTGGAGFVGRHLCERLLEAGNEVTCLDDFTTGYFDNIKKLEGLEVIRHDISHSFLHLGLRVDEIYNLACPASPAYYQKNPVQTLNTSILGSINVLEFALRSGAKVLHTSTSEVYGDPEVHPQPETYWGNVNPIGPRACYDEGKRAAEAYMFAYNKMHWVPIKVVRIFNTYGPYMSPDDGRVVSNFITQAYNKEPLTIYGDGSYTRSFQYVSDLIDGLIAMMGSDNDVIGPINLGNPHTECTIKELAEMVISMTGSSSEIVYKPLPIDDPQKRKPDISKAKEVLGWEPKVVLDDGLMETMDYFYGGPDYVRG